MNRLILGITVILTVLLSASILVASDDSDAAVSDNVKVYIELEDGSYDMAVIDGVNKMEDAVKQAADELGLGEIEMLSSGRGIKSVGGRVPLADHYWVVHQWLPHSSDEHTAIPGWGEVSVDGEFDDYLR
ncbi:MAG: hypothetical protein MJZ68_07460, partial [archaeon]|nr:hypothetical protein [archaeon]